MVLTGFSLGGAGVFVLASAPGGDIWSALWAVAPTPLSGKPVPALHRRVLVHYSHNDSVTCAKEVEDYCDRAKIGKHFPSSWRVKKMSKPENHCEVCVEAYKEANAYDWVLSTAVVTDSRRL